MGTVFNKLPKKERRGELNVAIFRFTSLCSLTQESRCQEEMMDRDWHD